MLLAPQFPYRLGTSPVGGVSLGRSGTLYTTFQSGGQAEAGGVVRLTPTGTHDQFLFDGKDGEGPTAGVLVDFASAALYGTTSGNEITGGTVFKLTPPAEETVLYSFCSQQNCTDGLAPTAALVADKAGNLYGTTEAGGANTSCGSGTGCGVVFEVSPQAPSRAAVQ